MTVMDLPPLPKTAVPQWANEAFTEIAGCFDAAMSEGLLEALAETTDERLKDLVERRLMYAHAIASKAAAPTPEGKPEQAEAPSIPKELDVRTILLDITPGWDGMGHEVYAKSVADVEATLSKMGLELEDWRMGVRRYATHPPASSAGEQEIDDAFEVARAALVRPSTFPEIRHVLDVLKTRVRAALASKPLEQKPVGGAK